MPISSIKISSSASVANVSCGLDCIGYSISNPNDKLTIETQDKNVIDIEIMGNNEGSIPTDPSKNTAGKAVISLLDSIDEKQGFKIKIEKGIPPGSGIGSSAASAAAAVIGANELLGKPVDKNDLLLHGMAGEAAASGAPHADNIAPALYGGCILIRSYDPLDILKLPVPKNLFSTVVLPELMINTLDARKVLPKEVKLSLAVEQTGNLAGFTLGLHNEDFELLGRSMVDHFAEPYRKQLIPGFIKVREAALNAGAIGCGISGSGPALFALSDSMEKSILIGERMVNAFKKEGLKSNSYQSSINTNPPEILD